MTACAAKIDKRKTYRKNLAFGFLGIISLHVIFILRIPDKNEELISHYSFNMRIV